MRAVLAKCILLLVLAIIRAIIVSAVEIKSSEVESDVLLQMILSSFWMFVIFFIAIRLPCWKQYGQELSLETGG
jgi:hypothetical protein